VRRLSVTNGRRGALRYLGRRQGTWLACLLAKAGARQQRRSSHSRVHPKATRPAAQAAGTDTADGSASVQKISPPPAATRGTHCRPPRPPASLSLFAEQEEKKCSETGLTPPRLHSRTSSPAGPPATPSCRSRPEWRSGQV